MWPVMEGFYIFVFGVLAAAAAAFEFTKPKEGQMSTSRDFLRFRTNYIVVYSMMMGMHRDLFFSVAWPADTPCISQNSLCLAVLQLRPVGPDLVRLSIQVRLPFCRTCSSAIDPCLSYTVQWIGFAAMCTIFAMICHDMQHIAALDSIHMCLVARNQQQCILCQACPEP